MNSLILQTTLRLLQPLLLMLSVFLLLVGHNEPGGGFTGGLLLSLVFALHTIAFNVEAARETLRVHPRQLVAVGLALAVGSGIISLLSGEAFMRGLWMSFSLAQLGEIHLGTPLLFDAGVYLVVCGVTLLIVFSLAED